MEKCIYVTIREAEQNCSTYGELVNQGPSWVKLLTCIASHGEKRAVAVTKPNANCLCHYLVLQIVSR